MLSSHCLWVRPVRLHRLVFVLGLVEVLEHRLVGCFVDMVEDDDGQGGKDEVWDDLV